jgi:hypothetical protein
MKEKQVMVLGELKHTRNKGKTIKMNVIDIVERFQMHHALQEEREFKNSHASRNGTGARSAVSNNGYARTSYSSAKKCGYRRPHSHATQNGRHRMTAEIVWSRGWAK